MLHKLTSVVDCAGYVIKFLDMLDKYPPSHIADYSRVVYRQPLHLLLTEEFFSLFVSRFNDCDVDVIIRIYLTPELLPLEDEAPLHLSYDVHADNCGR